MNDRELMRKLFQAKKVLGPKFSRDNFRTLEAQGFPNEYAYRKRFGSWGNTLRAMSKVEPTMETNPQLQVLMYLHKAKSILGESFTRDNYRYLKGFPTEYQVIKEFGTWSNAISAMETV